MNHRVVVIFYAAAIYVALAGCGVDDGTDELSTAQYSIDGTKAEVLERLVIAYVDQTRLDFGDRPSLFVTISEPARRSGKLLGNGVRINLPNSLGVGDHPVRFAALPTREHAWVEYFDEERTSWVGYSGDIHVESYAGVGSRLKLRFDRIALTNGCGERRVLESGGVDVVVGSEASIPDEPESTRDAGASYADSNENNVVVELDGATYGCSNASIYRTRSIRDDVTPTLRILAICACGLKPLEETAERSWSFLADLPADGKGIVSTAGDPYVYFVTDDPNGTYLNTEDDELWYTTDSAPMNYTELGAGLGGSVDVTLAGSLRFIRGIRVGSTIEFDSSRLRTVTQMHAYGLIEPDYF